MYLMGVPRILQKTLLAILLTLLPAWAFCLDVAPPVQHHEPTRGIARISDPHSLLRHEERAALEQQLAGLWTRSGLKISVLIDSPENSWESLESFTKRIAKRWGLTGISEQPGGILLVVDPQAKRAALSVSPELLTDFPAGSVERIINGNINPMLMQNALAGGISEGFERLAGYLDKPERVNRSLFAHGYGTLAAFGLFFVGMMLRRRWGALRSAAVTALCFATLICFDGFALGFPWYGVFSCAALAAFFLGLFVWIGMGNDAVDQQKGSV